MANLDADPLNMSLDDLIEKHREKGQKAKSAGGRRQSGGRGGRGRGSRETRGQGGGSNPTFVLNNTRNRAISKRPGRTARAVMWPPAVGWAHLLAADGFCYKHFSSFEDILLEPPVSLNRKLLLLPQPW